MVRHDVDPIILPRLAVWALLLGLLSYTVADPDLWGHVRFGADILDQGALPKTDPYSFTSDRRWVNHEWLSEVTMALAYRAGGPMGLATLKLLLLIATFGLIARELARRQVAPVAQDLLLALAVIGCAAITRTVRPQMFSLLLFTCLVIAIRRAEDGERRWLWLAPAIMPLWPNLHGGWLVGLGIYGIWTAIRCVWPRGPSRLAWAGAGIVALIGTLATPEGVGMWRFLWDTVGLGRPDVSEWQPLTRRPPGDSVPWVVAGIVAVLTLVRSREWRATDLAAVLVLMFVSFRVVRVVPFLVLAVVILIGPLVGRRSSRVRHAQPAPPRAALAVIGAVVLVFILGSAVTAFQNLSCIRMAGSWMVDQQAAAFIRDTGMSGRMLTWFDWGEYAIWFLSPQIRVSMDGRRETIYSDEILRLHNAIYRGEPGWQEALRRIDPQHIWLPATAPTLDEIGRMGWHLVLETEQSQVLSRSEVLPPATPATSPEVCFPGAP